jgi:hypothetical protein
LGRLHLCQTATITGHDSWRYGKRDWCCRYPSSREAAAKSGDSSNTFSFAIDWGHSEVVDAAPVASASAAAAAAADVTHRQMNRTVG